MGKQKKKRKIRLSQCLIVKNEEHNIRSALSWGKELVWEQIVVDTGSTDHTVRIAEEMGAKVFSFPWKDDFSAAKNFALEQAKGNWIAFLDADETLPDKDAKELLRLLELIDSDAAIDAVQTKLVNLGDDNQVMGVFNQVRVFRNDLEIRYRFRIHETLFYKNRTLRHYDAQDSIAILHTGYNSENRRGTEKGERNVRLLQMDLEAEPDNLLRLMYLGDAWVLAGRSEDAMECYRKVLRLYPQKNKRNSNEENRIALLRSGLQLMAVLSSFPAEAIQEEYLQITKLLWEEGWNEHPDIDYFLAICYLKTNTLDLASQHFEQALEKVDRYQGVEVVRMAANLKVAAITVALVSEQKGDLPKAVHYAVMVLRIDKYASDALLILLRSFLTEYQEGNIDPYWHMLVQVYDPSNLKDLFFLHKMAGESGFFALQERVLTEIPQEAHEQLLSREMKENSRRDTNHAAE